MKLTIKQHIILADCANGGIAKGDTLGLYWRNFDQLERRGLIKQDGRPGFRKYFATDAGRAALIEVSKSAVRGGMST